MKTANMAALLDDNTLVLNLTLGKPSAVRKVRKGADKISAEGTDTTRLRVSMQLMNCPQFDKIVSCDAGFRIRLGQMVLPSPYKKGVYRIPLVSVTILEDMLVEHMRVRDLYIEAYGQHYNAAVAQSEKDLGPLYDASLYPSWDEVKRSFYMSWCWQSYAPPSALADINAALFQKERTKAHKAAEAEADLYTDVMVLEARKLVAHVADMLETDPETGQPARRIFKSVIPTLREGLSAIETRNVMKSDELTNLIASVRKVVGDEAHGLDSDELKSLDSLREETRKAFQAIQTTIDESIEAKPRRKILLRKRATSKTEETVAA